MFIHLTNGRYMSDVSYVTTKRKSKNALYVRTPIQDISNKISDKDTYRAKHNTTCSYRELQDMFLKSLHQITVRQKLKNVFTKCNQTVIGTKYAISNPNRRLGLFRCEKYWILLLWPFQLCSCYLLFRQVFYSCLHSGETDPAIPRTFLFWDIDLRLVLSGNEP